MSAGSHESPRMKTDHWLTPPDLVRALGPFDLDPCYSKPRPWPTAETMWGLPEHDGLAETWFGRVWLNPPYGREAAKWLLRLAEHGDGIALIFARTETGSWFDYIWPRASAILFMRGRVTFCRGDGTPAGANGGAPTALVAYGGRNVEALREGGIEGRLVFGESTVHVVARQDSAPKADPTPSVAHETRQPGHQLTPEQIREMFS